MQDKQNNFTNLQKIIEKIVGREMLTPRDFDFLSIRILDITGQYLSAITLKRLWGYLGEKYKIEPRNSTLNILAQAAGYTNWESYYKDFTGESKAQSAFLNNRTLYTNQLAQKSLVELKWEPNRKVVIKHNGFEVFEVVESINSKLSVGDTFRCGLIIENEPMFLQGIIHKGQTYNSYVCGSESGVKFKVISNK